MAKRMKRAVEATFLFYTEGPFWRLLWLQHVGEATQLALYWDLPVKRCLPVVQRAWREKLPAMDLMALAEAYECGLDDAVDRLKGIRRVHAAPFN